MRGLILVNVINQKNSTISAVVRIMLFSQLFSGWVELSSTAPYRSSRRTYNILGHGPLILK